MESSLCPKCNGELAGKSECACGWKADDSVAPAPAASDDGAATPAASNPAAAGASPDNKQLGPPPARNLRPPAPQPPAKPAAAEASGDAAAAVKEDNNARQPGHSEEKENEGKGKKKPARPRDAEDPRAAELFRQFVMSQGNQNIHAQNLTLYGYPWPNSSEPGGAAVESLIEITAALSSKSPSTPDFESEELGRYAAELRIGRILLLGCADETVALGAAYALMDEMRVADECRRSLDFLNRAQEKCDLFPELLSRKTDGGRRLTAVVVETYSNGSKAFRDWLGQVEHVASQRIRDELRDNNYLLVCLVDAAYLGRAESDLRAANRRLNFTCWKISFLRPLLKHYFPERHAELEERLLRQRAEGKWKRDETEFCHEVRDYVEAGLLPEEIEARARGQAPPAAVPQLRGGKAVEDALLYTATYFPDLTLREFDEVVDLLLEGKTTTVTVKSVRTNKDGESESFDAEVQKPLAELWVESTDEYLEACQLEAAPQPDATTAVNFSGGKLRDDVRQALETKHRMYALRQFQTLERRGLLFHTSPRVSAAMMRLCVRMALSHPDVVGTDWLYETVTAVGAAGPRAVKFPPGVPRPEAYAYERLAQLLRQMLDEPNLEETVGSLMHRLIGAGMHEALLELIRGLQFAPKIKEFGWIKRVLDEGRPEAREAARRLLYGYVKKIGPYSLLEALEHWLPKRDQPPEEYTQSGVAALRVLAEHCVETRAAFELADYGAWPSRHPLFTFEDAAAAEGGLARLFRWMLNPAMRYVFEEVGLTAEAGFDYSPATFVGDFVAEWSFVLLGPGGAAAAGEPSPPGAPFGAAAAREIMIGQLVKATDRAQRDELLRYWESVRDFLGLVMDRRGYLEYLLDREEQKIVRWKREVVRGLIRRFREISWRHKASAPAAGAVKVERGVM